MGPAIHRADLNKEHLAHRIRERLEHAVGE